jgi:hypothetical protein
MVCVSLVSALVNSAPSHAAGAATVINTVTTTGTTSVSLPASTISTGQMVVVTCSSSVSTTLSLSGTFALTTLLNQAGTPSLLSASGYVTTTYNNISTAYTCTAGSAGTISLTWYVITGLDNVSPVTGSSRGSGATQSSGTLTTSFVNTYLFAVITSNDSTLQSGWTNGFTAITSGGQSGGKLADRASFGSAGSNVTTTGSYSTTATAGNTTWVGHIIGFQAHIPEFSAKIVDGTGTVVTSPNFVMTTLNSSFSCQLATGSLGTTTQRLRVTNETSNPSWSLSIAATGGTSAPWTSGANNYSYNNAAGGGCTAGQLAINPSVATWGGTCATTGVSLGSNTAYSNGSVDSITLASATASASTACYWELTGIALSQQVPPEQPAGSYVLPMTITLVAI